MEYKSNLPKKKNVLTPAFLMLILAVFIAVPKMTEANMIIKIGSDVTVEEGTIIGNAIVIGGQITVYGKVEHHVVAVGGSVVLGSTAAVGGNVISVGGIIVRGRGAEVSGNITEINSSEISNLIESVISGDWQGWSWIYAILSIFVFIGVLVLAILIAAFVPNHIQHISSAIQDDSLKVILLGILGLVMIVPLAVLLTISVIGIVLIPLEMVLVTCAVLVGLTALSQLVGEHMFLLMKKSHRGIIGQTIWGLLILWIMGWLPYVGIMIKVFAVVLAFGGVLVTRFGTKPKLIDVN